MSAKKAIRLYCLWCTKDQRVEIKECPANDCPVHRFRMGETIQGDSKQKAVKEKCKNCIDTNRTSICIEKSCPLWAYRTGRNSNRAKLENKVKKILTEEHLAKLKQGRTRLNKPS